MGFALFMPKFIEFHFRQKASTSGASGGIAKTLSSVVGLLVSGWIIGRWRFRARALAGWCAFADLLAIVGITCISVFSCPASYFPDVDIDRSRLDIFKFTIYSEPIPSSSTLIRMSIFIGVVRTETEI
jgi:hypothetical protein